jgi:hypothetical protein
MIDYFKGRIKDPRMLQCLINNKKLKFVSLVDLETAEMFQSLYCKYENFQIRIKNGYAEIRGSIHKFWNGGTNENDFRYSELVKAILRLCCDLDIEPEKVSLHNLEIGVNIHPSYCADDLLKQAIVYKNSPPLRPYAGGNARFDFLEFYKDGYYLKIYDKGRQYGVQNTLRIEVKAMTAKQMKVASISTLGDLMKLDKLKTLSKELIKKTSAIVFDDPSVLMKALNESDRKIYEAYVNPNHWRNNKGKKNSTIRRQENRFRTIVNVYGDQKIYDYILGLVVKKVDDLLHPVDFPISV